MFIAGVMALGSGGVRDAAAVRLWSPDSLPVGFVPTPEALSSQAIVIDTLRLDSDPDSILAFPLAGGDSLNVVRVRREHPGGNKLVWFGRLVDDPRSSVTIARVRGVLVGNITTSKGRRYRIRYAGSGVEVLEEVDVSLFPDEGKPQSASLSTGAAGTTCTTDDARQIDILVVYTAAALTGAGGADAMEASIYLMVGDTNQSYENSGIEQRIRLVHFEQVTYVGTGSAPLDLDALVYTGHPDEALDEVQGLRDAVGADAAVLVVEDAGSYCGLSKMLDDVSLANAQYAFAVVGRECALVMYTFAHELGHIMAARHDWAEDTEAGKPYVFNHGFVHRNLTTVPKSAWRTIMAVMDDCVTSGIADADCIRLLSWSNPYKTRDGVDMGSASDPQQADNRLTLNTSAPTIANYRCGIPGRADAWMKDAWSDTGAEPEPGLAGEPMWKSPYIWVRNEADPDRIHAHDHQNPIKGSVNYAYVKIHGGTTAISGDLELYAAKASTGLSWPTEWTRIGTMSLAPLAEYDTRIIEFPWTPTGDGHFCLVARWAAGAADPMTTPEGTSIEANVRGNNNLVWRNVNIIELVAGATSTALMTIANTGKSAATYALSIVPSRGQVDEDILGAIDVQVKLDRLFQKFWLGERVIGRVTHGRGFERTSRDVLTARAEGMVLEGLRLPPGTRVPIRLVFKRPSRALTRPGTSMLDVIQTQTDARRPRVVGGVSYEIRVLPSRTITRP